MAKKTQKVVKLHYSKDLGINNAKAYHTELKKALKNKTDVEVKVDKVETLDLTFIQLLYSLKKSVEKSNKKISFNIKLNNESELLLSNAGLTNLF